MSTAVARLVEVADDAKATSIWTTWGGDPHRDHKATAALALALRDRLPGIAHWSYRYRDGSATTPRPR